RSHGYVESVSAHVRRLAKEINRRFGVSILKLAVGRAHSAHGHERAGRALGYSRGLPAPHFIDKTFPPFAETPPAQVVCVKVRKHADAHLPFGVYGERVNPAAAVIDFAARLRR